MVLAPRAVDPPRAPARRDHSEATCSCWQLRPPAMASFPPVGEEIANTAPATEDSWTFDVTGYLHVPAQLSPGQVAAMSAAAGPGPQLAEQLCLVHPALMARVSEVTEGETRYRLSETPRLLPRDAAAVGGEGWLTAVAPEDVRRLAYEIGMYPAQRAQVKGIRVLWVLEDTDALRVVAASHKSSTPPPPPAVAAEMGAMDAPSLRAGDLLLLAGTTLMAWQPAAAAARVVEVVLEWDSRSADWVDIKKRRPDGAVDLAPPPPEFFLTDAVDLIGPQPPLPDWFAELSPAQQAVCGGHAAMGAVDISDDPVVELQLKALPTASVARTQDEAERWFFDVTGYLIISDVMDAQWLADANNAIDIKMQDPLSLKCVYSSGPPILLSLSLVRLDRSARAMSVSVSDRAALSTREGSLWTRAQTRSWKTTACLSRQKS